MKNIKEAFKLKDEERKGKNYYEMNLLESCDLLKKVVQKIILEKIKFLLIFGFSDPLFDPFCGLGLFYKISAILGLNNTDKEVKKIELDNYAILENIEKQGIKIENSWKILFKLD